MAHPMTLPALAGLAIIAVAAGVQLGLGAVAEMDGAHRGAAEATRPLSGLNSHRSPSETAPEPEARPIPASPIEIGIADLGGCYGCGAGAYPQRRDQPLDGYRVGTPAPTGEDPAPKVETPPPPSAAEATPPPAMDDIERHARYPAGEDEARPAAPDAR